VATGRIYTVTSALVTYTGTSATSILYGATASTNPADILAIRVGVYSGSGVSYPSNGTVLCQLCRATTSGESGGATALASPHNASDIAANTTFKDASTGAITNTTQGVVLWEQSLPFTAGANWAEWVTPGSEWRVAASAELGVYLSASSAGTATQFQVSLVFAE
jgi:hypothetical protein